MNAADESSSPFLSKGVLIVVGILFALAALAALLLPQICSARETARGNTCRCRLRMFATALFNYSVRNDHYPGYLNSLEKFDGTPFTDPTLSGSTSKLPVSWVVLILPDIDRQDLYDRWRDVPKEHVAKVPDALSPTNDAPPGEFFRQGCSSFQCPSDPRTPMSDSRISYIVNTGMPDLSASSSAWIDFDGSVTPGGPRDWMANGMFFDNFTNGPWMIARDERVADPKDKTILLTENIDATSYVFRAATHGADNWKAAEVQTGCIWRPGKVDESKDPPTMTPSVASLQPNVGIGLEDGTSYDYCRPSSRHPQSFNVAFAGQNVSSLRDNVSYYVYAKLMASDDENVRIPGKSLEETTSALGRQFRTRELYDVDINP
jgi:hypothetical protein